MIKRSVPFLHRLTALITLWAFAFTTLAPTHGALSQARDIFVFRPKTQPETIRDRAGNVTIHRYDERGNITQSTMPDGTVTATAYHVWDDGRKSELKTAESVTGLFTKPDGTLEQRTISTTCAYEDEDPATPIANDGLLRKVTDALGHVSRFSYDARGNVLSVVDALGRTTTNTYYAISTRLHTSTDALGNVTTLTCDARGQMDTESRTVTVVDAAGVSAVQTLVSDYDYDASGNLTRMVDAKGHATNYEYDTNGNRTFERTTRTDAAGVVHQIASEHVYDADSRLVKSWDTEHPRALFPNAPTSETI